MVIRNRAGDVIRNLEDWETLAPPASRTHWKDGRSAKELAKAWSDGSGPALVVQAFSQTEDLGTLEIHDVTVEAQVAFDEFPGGKRNHDLLIHGTCDSGRVVIGLKAKADESYGETVASYHRKALATRTAGGITNAPERLRGLLMDFCLSSLETHTTLGDLRYQLFSGVAGTLAAVSGPSQLAVFFVHEFATPQTSPTKRAENQVDLNRFLGDVFGAAALDVNPWLIEPTARRRRR
jgi:hypothetical protein